MITILNDSQLVADIFEEEFDSIPPTGGQGGVIAVVEKGKIEAFIMLEQLIRAGLLWVAPEHRNSPKATKLMRELVRFVHDNSAPNTSVVTFDTEGEFGRILEKVGMKKVDGVVYRKDF